MWGNVPPAPSQEFAATYGLGDKSFAYRVNGLAIQNLGDTGGRITALKDYNYERLAKWFFLEDSLDPHSEYIPYLAGYYFSATQNPKEYAPVLDYLALIGNRSDGEKWRWLAQAVYIARFLMDDMDKSLELANLLAQTKSENVPSWTRQMPAFVMTAKGDKDAAYALFLEILKSSASTMHPNEINSMKIYICTRILDAQDAAKNTLCQDIK